MKWLLQSLVEILLESLLRASSNCIDFSHAPPAVAVFLFVIRDSRLETLLLNWIEALSRVEKELVSYSVIESHNDIMYTL